MKGDPSSSQDTQHEVTGNIATPPGWNASPSQDTEHEVTWSIATPPGWNASPSQDTQHEVTRAMSTLYRIARAPAQKPYRIGLLFTKGTLISARFLQRSDAAPLRS